MTETTKKTPTQSTSFASNSDIAMMMALKPRISEKAYTSAEEENIYMFEVPKNASKQSIADAVESQFKVKVKNVRIANIKGKPKRAIRKRQRPASGKRKDIKKAYVSLNPENKINIFGSDDKKKKTAKSEIATTETKTTDKVQKKSGLKRVFNRGPRHTQDKGGGK